MLIPCVVSLETVKTPKLISFQRKDNQLLTAGHYSCRRKKATLRNKRKLAALNKENSEEHPRNILAQNSNFPRSQEDYITKCFEDIEGRATKKLSQEFSRTENRILGALAHLDDYIMIPIIQGHSGTAPEASRNSLSTSQGLN